MSDKPPIQKPPVRTHGGPSVPPPQPIYQPVVQPVIQPVHYVPVAPPVHYEPPPMKGTAPMTSFVAVLGWVSLIWAIGMVVLGFFLRMASMAALGESLATVSMWLSVVLIPLGMIGGLFALFELGREVEDDIPKPTFVRLCLAAAMVVGGVGGQAWFSYYLTSSSAAILATRLHGTWERVSQAVNNPNAQPWQMKQAEAPATKNWTDEKGGSAGDEPKDIVIEFTPGGTISLKRPGVEAAEQFHYSATSASTLSLSRMRYGHEEVEVEFMSNGDMMLSTKDWWRQSDILGRYSRIGDPELGPEVDPALAGPWAESLTKLKTELATYEQKRKNLAKFATTLEADKKKLTAELRGYGVNSAADLNGKGQAAREISKELVDLGRQIEITHRKLDDSEGMVVKIKSALRQIGRRVALARAEGTTEDDEKQLMQAKVLLADLSEQLGDRSIADKEVNAINEQVMLDKVLKDQLRSTDTKSQDANVLDKRDDLDPLK